MVLRVHQITPSGATAASFDVEVLGLQGQRYVDVVGENRLYRGELGLLRSDGSLVSLAVSADAELPRLGPAGEGARGHASENAWGAGTHNGAGAVATAERAGESSLPAATQRAVRLRSTSSRAACCCGGHYRGTAGGSS